MTKNLILQKELVELAIKHEGSAIRKLLAEHGYYGSSADCAEFAQAIVQTGGYVGLKEGWTIASNWQLWGESAVGVEANEKETTLGRMIAVSRVHTYGGEVGAPIHPGQTGGHVMPVIPGTYNSHNNTVGVYSPDPARQTEIKAYGGSYMLRKAV